MGSSQEYGPEELGGDVILQLNWIKKKLQNGSATRMQGFFKEGYVLSYALYGVSWVGVGKRVAPGSEIRKKAIKEAVWALEHMENDVSKSSFEHKSKPSFGIFYTGWTNWLRGGILMLQTKDEYWEPMVDKFKSDAASIADAYNTSAFPFLETYPQTVRPCDNMPALASLRLHDKLFDAKYEETVSQWIVNIPRFLDPQTGLFPHETDPLTGRPSIGSNGTSQAIILAFINEIDPKFGREQYTRFRKQFLSRLFGITGILEYPQNSLHGNTPEPRTGSIIAGISLAATNNILAAAQVQGDRELATARIQAGESLGIPIRTETEKWYFGGVLPLADEFTVWGKTATPWIDTWSNPGLFPVIPLWWRLPLHTISGVILLLAYVAGRRRKSRKNESEKPEEESIAYTETVREHRTLSAYHPPSEPEPEPEASRPRVTPMFQRDNAKLPEIPPESVSKIPSPLFKRKHDQ